MVKTKADLRRNLIAYYASRADMLALAVVAIISIWLKSGMDLAQILLLQGIFGLFLMLMEFPSGVLADVTSRRIVLISAYISEVIALSLYLVGNSFPWYVAAEFFFSIALSFQSGSDTAMIYDSFENLGRNSEGENTLATGSSYSFASMVVMQATGGVIAAFSVSLVILMTIFGVVIQAFLYMRSVEPIRGEMRSSSQTTKMALSKLKDIQLVRILLVSVIASIFLTVSFWDYIPRFKAIDLPSWSFGFLLSAANLVAFLASLVVRKKKELQSSINVYAIAGTIGVGLWIVANNLWLVLIAILFHQITRGGFRVAKVVSVNKHAENEIRASVHSLISAIGSGLYFLFSVTFEIIGLGTQIILVSSFIGTLLITILVIILGAKEVTMKKLDLNLDLNIVDR